MHRSFQPDRLLNGSVHPGRVVRRVPALLPPRTTGGMSGRVSTGQLSSSGVTVDNDKSFRMRRIADGPRKIRSAFRRQRQYEIYRSNGERSVVGLAEPRALLNGRKYPADFWACVDAADEAFTSGFHDVLIDWPSGQRFEHR